MQNNSRPTSGRHLRRSSAKVKFLSLEPILDPLEGLNLTGIDWVIVGGESERGARDCRLSWIRDVVRQCKAAGVPVFVKQLGKRPIQDDGTLLDLKKFKGNDLNEWPADLRVREMPTKIFKIALSGDVRN